MKKNCWHVCELQFFALLLCGWSGFVSISICIRCGKSILSLSFSRLSHSHSVLTSRWLCWIENIDIYGKKLKSSTCSLQMRYTYKQPLANTHRIFFSSISSQISYWVRAHLFWYVKLFWWIWLGNQYRMWIFGKWLKFGDDSPFAFSFYYENVFWLFSVDAGGWVEENALLKVFG